MSDAAHWQYSEGPRGQPAPMVEGEYVATSPRPSLFGMGMRDDRGRPRVIIAPNPAAGSDWTYTHSGPSWFFLRTVALQLRTSAAVATRIVRLQLTFLSVVVAQFAPTATQAAGLTVIYTGTSAPVASGDPATAYISLPNELIIQDGMTLGSSTTALQAADQFSLIALLGEEFTDVCLY